MKKTLTPKKIDITSLKVIDKKNLNTLYGGAAAPQYTSVVMDYDKGGNCSWIIDIDSPA